ncbi:MAG: TonB-dependent receptor [Acidobacteria bacterium]|nr:TonB-dependent receptor [Acidobacteriota bacterium]
MGSREITVFTARYAFRGTTRRGQLIVLDGGPGSSGVFLAPGVTPTLEAYRANGWDLYIPMHRGIGHSTQLACKTPPSDSLAGDPAVFEVIELGRVVRLDIALSLTQISESIDVTGAAPLLESETATLGQFIENKTIADMPLNGRRVGDLLALQGSAVYVTGDVIRPRVAIAGGRADQQQWLIDGVNGSNIALEVPQALFNPPVESVQEIRIQQSAYSAEFGNSSSGVVTMTTRSGTNKYTGLAYHSLRNDAFDARNFFATSRPPLRWNVFGLAAGGPVVIPKLYNGKNRTFFFSHNEWQIQRIGAVRNLTVPTAQQIRGDFSQTLTAGSALIPIFDPASSRPGATVRTPFPGNVIPENRIDPVGSRFAQFFPPPNRAAINAAGANNFTANAGNVLDLTTWTSKGDHIFNDKDRMSVRYILHNFPTANLVVYPEPAADPNGSRSLRRAHSLLINHTHSFAPTVLNDFRYNLQPRFFKNLSLGLDQGWPAKLGLKGVNDRAFPQVTAAGFANLGAGTHERIQTPIVDQHIVNALSIYRGKHSIKAGGEFRHGRNVDVFNQLISGSFAFNVQPTQQPGVNNTGNSLASLLLGFPNAATVRFTDVLDRRASYFAGFLQDDWKVTSNLTLNLGVRWETHTPRVDASDRQNSFDRNAVNPVSGTPGVVTFAGRDGLGRTIYDGDWNNFAPRVGIAWKPFGGKATVVRTGYGTFFGVPLPGSNNASAGFETSGSFTTPDNGITAPFFLRDGVPDTSRTAQNSSFGAVRVGQAIRFAPEFIDQRRQLGYTHQWNFSIQQELRGRMLVEAAYIGNAGHKLNGPNLNINQVHPSQLVAGNTQTRRPFPQFGNVVSITPMLGNSNYHALNLKIEKRFANGLNFLANYSWSKFIDDVPAAQENGALTGGPQNVYDLRSERSLSGNDVRNRFVWSSVYELPFGKGRPFMNTGKAGAVLGGWNIGMIATLQAGSPVGLTVQNNNTNAFSGPQRVNLLRNPELPKGERSVARWFDTAAVAAPAPLTFGNSARALLTGPGVANFDMSLLKNTAITEQVNLQFRAESFNVFNRANFEEPARALGAPGFGVISEARAARTMQLGLKLTF